MTHNLLIGRKIWCQLIRTDDLGSPVLVFPVVQAECLQGPGYFLFLGKVCYLLGGGGGGGGGGWGFRGEGHQ